MKRIGISVRVTLSILIFSMAILVFAGCSPKPTEDPARTGSIGSGETDGTGEYDKKGYLKDTLPDSLNFRNTPVTVLGWNSEVTEFDVKELNGNLIDESLWYRDQTVCTRLGIDLDYTITNGSVAYINDYKTTVQNAILNGTPYDIVAAHTRSIAVCAVNGLLKDLGNLENSYLDFGAPWWNQSIIEKTMLGNSFFFVTGDIAPSFVQMIYCVYFNADLLRNRGLESPYDMVASNEWTLENMMTLTANFYQDLNENFNVDLSDNIPLVGQYYDWPAFLHGCSVEMVIPNESGDLVIAPDLKGEKAINIMNSLQDWVTLDNCYVGTDTNIVGHFLEQKSMFLITQTGRAAMSFADVTFEYACVPMPKYSSDQETYVSTARQPVSLFAISKTVADDRMEMVTASMECMASEGYRQTTPVIFDTVMQYQKSASPEMTEMLGLIRDSAWFDFGRIYAADLTAGGGVMCDQPGLYLRDNKPWENYLNGGMKTVEAQLVKLSETLVKLGQG